jgi:hypothetical protein
MEKNHKSKNGADSSEAKEPTAKKIPIIQTLKPKKRYSKLEKEMIKAGQAAMEAIGRYQENGKV